MRLDLKDLLIEKPATLLFWELDSSFKDFLSFLEKETEVKVISSLEEFFAWLSSVEVKNFIAGIKHLERLKEINQLLERLPMEKRREIFIIFISPEFKTLDSKESFLYSANLVVNERDLPEMEKIYNKAKTYWINLYKPYYQMRNKILEEEL